MVDPFWSVRWDAPGRAAVEGLTRPGPVRGAAVARSTCAGVADTRVPTQPNRDPLLAGCLRACVVPRRYGVHGHQETTRGGSEV